MSQMLSPKDVANAVKSFVMVNEGDEETVSLILAIGAELLDISVERW